MILRLPNWLARRRHWVNRRWLWTGVVVIYWRAEVVRFDCVTALLNATLYLIQHAPVPIGAKEVAVNMIDKAFYRARR